MPDWDALEERLNFEVSTYLRDYATQLYCGRGLPEVNVGLLRKTVEWAETESARGDESLWRQSYWCRATECGTAYCIAGRVLEQEGYTFEWDEDQIMAVGVVGPDGESGTFRRSAAQLLGITGLEADMLFNAANSLDEVKLIANMILERVGDKL